MSDGSLTSEDPLPDEGPRGGMLRNSGALLASRLVVAALGWLGSVVIIRTLSVDDFGRFTLVFSILGLLSVITDMGIGRVAVGMFVDQPADAQARLGGRYVTLRALLGVVGYVVALAVVMLGGYGSSTVAATAVAGLVVVLLTITNAHSVVFQAKERLVLPAVASSVGTAAQLALILVLSTRTDALVPYMVPSVLAALVEFIVLVPAVRRLVPLRYGVDLKLWRRLLAEAVPISVGSAMATLYYRVDGVMLSQLASLTDVAIYGVAYKFVDIVHVVPWAVSTAALPRLVKRWPDAVASFRAEARHAALLLAVIAGFVLAEFEALAPQVVPFLYGEQYADAVLPARIVVLSECLSFAGAFSLLVLIATAHHRRYPWIAAAGLVLNVGLNLVLIPSRGVVGAAFATVVTDLTVATLLAVLLHRSGVLRGTRGWRLGRVALATAITTGVALLLESWVPWIVAAAVAGAVYVGLLLALRTFGPRGWRGMLHADPVDSPAPGTG